MEHTINVKRVYADPSGDTGDGFRVFVDRLWPRGESKEKFHYDLWAKDIAPSTELREWFHADPADRWDEFVNKYTDELKNNPAVKDLVDELKTHKVITLLFGSHDQEHNNAVILAKYLESVL